MIYTNKILGKHKITDRANILNVVPRHNGACIKSTFSCRRAHHVTRLNTPIHNILLTAAQFSTSQKALGTLPEDGNVLPKHGGATIHN
jgi:hypothetical protein